jgi:hypothetical protein
MSVKIVKQTPSSTEIFDGTFPTIEDINWLSMLFISAYKYRHEWTEKNVLLKQTTICWITFQQWLCIMKKRKRIEVGPWNVIVFQKCRLLTTRRDVSKWCVFLLSRLYSYRKFL